jgi:hypothetical protein
VVLLRLHVRRRRARRVPPGLRGRLLPVLRRRRVLLLLLLLLLLLVVPLVPALFGGELVRVW